METWGEEENDCATKQSSLLMRSSDHLSTFKLCNEINVTSTSTSEFDCSTYFCCIILQPVDSLLLKGDSTFGCQDRFCLCRGHVTLT